MCTIKAVKIFILGHQVKNHVCLSEDYIVIYNSKVFIQIAKQTTLSAGEFCLMEFRQKFICS